MVVCWVDWFVFTVPSGFELLGLLESQNQERPIGERKAKDDGVWLNPD